MKLFIYHFTIIVIKLRVTDGFRTAHFALCQTEFTLWLPRMINNNLFYHVNGSRLILQERSIHTCCLLASTSEQFSLIVSVAIGLLINRVATQKDGSCPCPCPCQSVDFFYHLRKTSLLSRDRTSCESNRRVY